MEFAREVAETKTMDDTLNRLEGMISGVDPKEESVTAKRGDIAAISASPMLPPVQTSDITSTGQGSTGQVSTGQDTGAVSFTSEPFCRHRWIYESILLYQFIKYLCRTARAQSILEAVEKVQMWVIMLSKISQVKKVIIAVFEYQAS